MASFSLSCSSAGASSSSTVPVVGGGIGKSDGTVTGNSGGSPAGSGTLGRRGGACARVADELFMWQRYRDCFLSSVLQRTDGNARSAFYRRRACRRGVGSVG